MVALRKRERRIGSRWLLNFSSIPLDFLWGFLDLDPKELVLDFGFEQVNSGFIN